MVSWQVKPEESGGRMDKFLKKRLKSAPDSFFYKMARKKNLLLNGAKCTGKEILKSGDEIKLYVSDSTIALFSGEEENSSNSLLKEASLAYQKLKGIEVIEEDDDLLFLYKPAGILTQKAEKESFSLNEWMIGYLLDSGKVNEESLNVFHPSVCNRLDRNTSGIVICGITPRGSRFASKMIKDRLVKKYYQCIVKGNCKLSGDYDGYLVKDEEKNISTYYKIESDIPSSSKKDAVPVSLSVNPLRSKGDKTLLEIELKTGKSHQIRVMLSSLGYPIVGDPKYGDSTGKGQLLSAVRLEFPEVEEEEFRDKYSNLVISHRPPFELRP
ncbi:MAG: RluA family pseudouridine synthase [Lachnospiraceae bacterium]|nr:RluA family pseudouridine synthase [Lachnospiraceae bacterium]